VSLSAQAWAQKAAPAGDGKELVAVMDLVGVDARKAELSALSEELRAQLLQTGKFRVLDRQQLEAVLNEQALQQTGCTSQECAVQVGKVLGVRKMVTGRVTKVSDNLWQVSARLVDVETAETVRAVTVNQKGEFAALLTEGVVVLMARLSGSAAPAVQAPAVPPQTSPQLSEGAILNGQQVERLISGKTMIGLTSGGGTSFKIRFEPDRRAVIDVRGSIVTGKWSLDGDKYCTQMTNSAPVACFTLKWMGGSTYSTTGPSGTFQVLVLDGQQ
jgi:hypothetical protein